MAVADTIGPLYTAGLVATTDQRPLDVINDLAQAMAGQVAFVANELRAIAGAYTAPVMELGDDDFAGGTVNIQARLPRENTFNVVTGTILDKDQNWTADVNFPRVPAQAYIDADGVELPLNVTFNAVNRGTQAQQLAAVMLRNARQALTLVATFKLTAYPLELFDTVAVSSTRYGWDAKAFMVVGRKWSLQGLIELTLRETDPTIFSFGNDFDAIDAAPNTNLPLSYLIETLSGLTVSSDDALQSDGSIVTRTLMTWSQATDESVLQNGKVEIQYLPITSAFPDGDWPGTTEQGGATQTTIVGLQGGQAYHFRGRFIGLGGRVRGPWSLQVLAIVQAPPKVAGANMLLNGSFEVATSGVPDQWTTFSAGATGTITHSDATGIYGSRAQQIACTALAVGGLAGYSQAVNVTGLGGQSVAQSIYAYGSVGRQVRVRIDFYTANGGSLISSAVSDLSLQNVAQRAVLIATVPMSCTYAVAFFLLQIPAGSGYAFMVIDGAQLEEGTSASAFSETADEALAAATTALAAAQAAAIQAEAAEAALNAIASDSTLTANEKQTAVTDYADILAEQAGIDAQATSFGITTEKASYDAAITALTVYLATLSGWNVIPGLNIAIDPATWRAKWSAVYTTRQTLLNAIATQASLRAQWAQVTGSGKPADNASADLVLIARGTCVVTGNSVTKASGNNAWDSDAYSKNGYPGGCFASAVPAQTGLFAMFGLNSDPTTDSSYTSLDYAFNLDASNALNIFESNVGIGLGGVTYAAGDVLSIIYDGAFVYYLQNNTLRRKVAAPANLNLFWDSSFFSTTARFDQIRFGPMSAVSNISTVQISPGAVSQITTPTTVTNLTVAGRSGTGSGSYTNTANWTHVGTHSFTAQASGLAFINALVQVSFSGVPSIYSDKLACEIVLNVDFNNDGSLDSGDRLIDDLTFAPTSSTTVPINSNRTVSVRVPFTLVSGTTYTWPIYAAALEGATGGVVLDTASLNVELFKV